MVKFIRRFGRIIPIKMKGPVADVGAAIGASVIVGTAVQKTRASIFEKIRGKGKTGTGNPIGTMVLDSAISATALTVLGRKLKPIGRGFSILNKITKIRR